MLYSISEKTPRKKITLAGTYAAKQVKHKEKCSQLFSKRLTYRCVFKFSVKIVPLYNATTHEY